MKKFIVYLKFIGIFMLSWVIIASVFYGLTELSFMIKAYSEFGKTLTRWFTQIMALIMAAYISYMVNSQ